MKKIQALMVAAALTLGLGALASASEEKKHGEKKDHKEKKDDHKKKEKH